MRRMTQTMNLTLGTVKDRRNGRALGHSTCGLSEAERRRGKRGTPQNKSSPMPKASGGSVGERRKGRVPGFGMPHETAVQPLVSLLLRSQPIHLADVLPLDDHHTLRKNGGKLCFRWLSGCKPLDILEAGQKTAPWTRTPPTDIPFVGYAKWFTRVTRLCRCAHLGDLILASTRKRPRRWGDVEEAKRSPRQ